MSAIHAFFQQSQRQVDAVLRQQLSSKTAFSAPLIETIEYAIFNGGKRFRPTLCFATALALNSRPEKVDCVAASIELIHCYSLVHDDLPALDNDDLRRGKPTCHKVFGEAMAILAGDALQAYAFELLLDLNPEIPADKKLFMIRHLAQACGLEGMAAGQALDLVSTNQPCSLEQLERIHRYKTGKMISACVELSSYTLSFADAEQHQALQSYARALGLAFQVKDDILDVEGSTEKLGKSQGADQLLNKSTYPSLLGMTAARQKAEQLHQEALSALKPFGEEASLLRELSAYVIHREN